MRTSAFISAAFAATALATPLRRRDVDIETVTDITYVTDIVTETAGAATAATSAATSATVVYHWPHFHKHSTSTAAAAAASSSSVAPVESSAPAPSTSEAPVETSSVYVAPSTSAAATTEAAQTTAALSTYQAATTSSTQPTTAAAAVPTSGFAYYDTTVYNSAVINHHNVHRSNHSAPNIAWNQTLAQIAKDIANTCVYKHNTTAGGGGYGQNIAAGVDPSGVSTVISDLFYNGEVNAYSGLYGQASPDMTNFESWGHFSQIVWKSTTQVACYTSNCTATASNPTGLSNLGGATNIPPYFTVCNYYTPGNYAGQYTNVGSPLGRATVSGSDSVTGYA